MNEDLRQIVVHVNYAEAEQLNFVLNNIENIIVHYTSRNIDVEIRVVCHGPGLTLLRVDNSPVLDRLTKMLGSLDSFKLFACGNTIERVTKAEGREPEIIPQAIVVPAGLPEIVELQREGWVYIKP